MLAFPEMSFFSAILPEYYVDEVKRKRKWKMQVQSNTKEPVF